MKIMANKQRGVSFSGFLLVAVVLVFVAVGGMKILPAYIQNNEIKGIFDTIARDPEMQGAQVKDIRESYAKRAMMNNITVVSPADIEISKEGGRLVLSISYAVRIPLVANATLLLEFNTSNSSR
ncbi:MAG: DUF4845 domain-containing protein [Betaproteobacteria bacterium]|nr:DUF4845 domain-containing protein [Betaproteobacteria bacterium]MDE2309810.1 DUF4845 domain-containing protein [Betaproteobacteria bacterium]